MVKRNYRDSVLKKVYKELLVQNSRAELEAFKNTSAAKETKVSKAASSIEDISQASVQVSTKQAKGPDKTTEGNGELNTKPSEAAPKAVVQDQPSGMLIMLK